LIEVSTERKWSGGQRGQGLVWRDASVWSRGCEVSVWKAHFGSVVTELKLFFRWLYGVAGDVEGWRLGGLKR